jgi:hypothetical protein
MKERVGIIIVSDTRWADMKDIKSKLHRVKLLDLIATELDGEPVIMFFVNSNEADFNLTVGTLELKYKTRGIYDI